MTPSKATFAKQPISLGVVGSADFGRRVSAQINKLADNIRAFSGGPSEAWSLILTNRPNALIVEIGIQHSERQQGFTRKLLAQIRERFKNEIYVVLALTSPQAFAYGGDCLFLEEDSLEPSGWVDSFIVQPPGALPSIPSLAEQIAGLMPLLQQEFERRNAGGPALPALGTSGWVQSMADPRSRELWMRWLPRYASYTNENPIITGKTGTGKTNLAYALHLLSGRTGKFISVTPRDFSSSELVQAELFGAVAGAYTGAVDKWGLVKSAEKGTLFIDELQSIDKDLQGKLITFIENKSYRRVGSSESIDADVRFVFATNRTLSDMMASDTLRDDFAYRLERVQLELLPLNQRRLDIPAALAFAFAKIRRQRPQSLAVQGMSSEAYRLLFSHLWTGNLRQLENTTARLCEHCDMSGNNIVDEATVLTVFDSKLSGTAMTAGEVISQAADRLSRVAASTGISNLESGLQVFEEMVRTSALEATGGDIDKAAGMIGDNRALMELIAKAILSKTAAQHIE